MTQKEWFEDQWFWEEFKPVLFPEGRLEKTDEQVDRLIDLLGLERDEKILDLACGVGRHTLELARRGYDVTGLDLSKKYMKEASDRAEKEGLEVEFIQRDMRDFVREDHYDAVINFWSSFGYFEDEEENFQVLKNVHRSLKEDGRFFVDVMGREILHSIFTEKDSSHLDDGFFVEERTLKHDGDFLESNWILAKDGDVKEHKFKYWLYSKEDIDDMLRRAGFADVSIYGDLECSEYDEDAERLIAVARK